MAFQKFTKDPDAILDYQWDWSAWLATVGDTLAAVAFIAEDGITVDSSEFSDTAATAWISGGTLGTTYSVVCRVTTTGGRVDDRTAELKIVER